jgi:hypothetical protein
MENNRKYHIYEVNSLNAKISERDERIRELENKMEHLRKSNDQFLDIIHHRNKKEMGTQTEKSITGLGLIKNAKEHVRIGNRKSKIKLKTEKFGKLKRAKIKNESPLVVTEIARILK